MKLQANKHAANYWTNTIVAFSFSLGFYELSIDGPTFYILLAFSFAAVYFAIFSVWNYQNWRLKNFLNSSEFRNQLQQVIVPIVEGNYSYKNAITNIKSQEFSSALKFQLRNDVQSGEKILSILPTDIELFVGTVKEFKVNIYFAVPEDGLTDDYIAHNWDSELLATSLDPLIDGG